MRYCAEQSGLVLVLSLETGAISLLPEKIDQLLRTGQLGPMIVPPDVRDVQRMCVFDPINDINHEQIFIERWQELSPGSGSHLCVPVGLQVKPLERPYTTPRGTWGLVNYMVHGDATKSAGPVGWLLQAHSWDVMDACSHSLEAGLIMLNGATSALKRWHDDPQYIRDWQLASNLHLMRAEEVADLTKNPRLFHIRNSWREG